MSPNKKTFRTTESFKQELLLKNEAYANSEFEITGEFKAPSTKIEVKTMYGYLDMIPEALLNNGKPRLLSARDKNAYFREMLREVWDEENYPNLLTDYVDWDTKLKVEKDGFVFLVRSTSLLRGNKYDIIENAEDQTALAISKLVSVHGDRYDYSKVKYNKSEGKVTIICKEHGEFDQVYNTHLAGSHCPKCMMGWSNDSDILVINKNNFLQKLAESNTQYKNGELEVLGEFEGILKHILVEDKYGKAVMTPRTLLKNTLPHLATAIDKTQYFINKATDVHKGKYTYEKAVYTSTKNKIIVTCPIHGDFEQQIQSHLQGQGCTKCKNEKTGWTYTAWSKAAPGNPGILYVLRCWNDDEEFYKIGITCQSKVGARYHNRLRMPYNYEIIEEIVSDDRKYIYKLEKQLKRNHKELAYEPKISFDGSKSECFINYKNTTMKNNKGGGCGCGRPKGGGCGKPK